MSQKEEIWFRGSEGNDISCNEGSVAFKLMTSDGSFTRIDGPGGVEVFVTSAQEPETKAEPVVVLSKLNRTELIAEAAKRGIVIDPDDKAQTKRVIIALIEAVENA